MADSDVDTTADGSPHDVDPSTNGGFRVVLAREVRYDDVQRARLRARAVVVFCFN